MAALLGRWIRKVSYLGKYDIDWLHYKSTASSHTEVLKYDAYKYLVEDTGDVVIVFVHRDRVIDSYRKVTKQFQYGDMWGRSFLVLHDKRLYQPPQQSFIDTEIEELSVSKSGYGRQFDADYGVGRYGYLDPLKDFGDGSVENEHPA